MRRIRLVVLLGVSVASGAHAQSIWSVHGPSASAVHLSGPPGTCGYPSGPVLETFNFSVPFTCLTPFSFADPSQTAIDLGDIAIDRLRDTVWITDGFIVTGYSKAGIPFASFASTLSGVRGIGWSTNPLGGSSLLWMTDGTVAQAMLLPISGCTNPVKVFGPWLVSFPGLAQDIDVDPTTGTVFIAYENGKVSSHTLSGAPGGFGVWSPTAACLSSNLVGLAVDTASCNAMYLTDGSTLTRVDFAGAVAPPTFYAPATCWAVSGPGIVSGIAFDASPVSYANGCDPAGPPPTAGSVLEPLSPDVGFALTVSNAAPGGGAFLLIGAAPACPQIPIGFGCAIQTFPLAAIVGPIAVPGTGSFSLPASIPSGLACSGATAYIQWLIAKPSGGLQATQALHVRPSAR